jgi:predicted Zn-dependent protease
MIRRPSRVFHVYRVLHAACVCIAACAFACSTNPVTGRPELLLMSTQQEAELGRKAAEQVAAQMGIVEDPGLVAYVSALGQHIARHSPRQDLTYQFQVVDMPEPNAFALPGGFVYVSRGLVALANDEAELANVIGHEIAHVAARHAAQRQTRAVGVGLVLLPAAIAGAALGSVLGAPGDAVSAGVNAPLQMLGVGMIAAYSRDQEREADRVGQAMVAEAGIDPHGMSDFMATLKAYEELQTGEARRPSFFDSHPATPERVDNTAQRAASLTWSPQPGVASDHAEFLRKIQGVLVGENPAEGVLEDERFLHPDLDFTVLFPEDWKSVNSRAAVGSFAPAEDGQIVLELAGEGDDPRAVANGELQKLGEQVSLQVAQSEDLQVGPHRAFRAAVIVSRGRDSVPLEFTWIAKSGLVYRFTAAARSDVFAGYRPLFRATPRSFRSLTAKERASIQEKRLRLAQARQGETLARLGSRSGNVWSAEETAVANGVDVGASLAAGQLVKVAVPQRYAPASAAR